MSCIFNSYIYKNHMTTLKLPFECLRVQNPRLFILWIQGSIDLIKYDDNHSIGYETWVVVYPQAPSPSFLSTCMGSLISITSNMIHGKANKRSALLPNLLTNRKQIWHIMLVST
jgi:hypothetical protein